MKELGEYVKKRKEGTPEPGVGAGSSRGTAAAFVVQKHSARRLHYDLRLELDGVLKSWSVPKGPSLDPSQRRLAVMVEDHPFDYKNFEGLIPKGHYGAGSVVVWDQGTYLAVGSNRREESDQIIRNGLKDGKVSIILTGQKLRGEFTLIRLKTENNWLFLKKADEFATTADITADNASVLTGKNNEDLERERSLADINKLKNEMPNVVEPMLAKLGEGPFDRPGWQFEPKWDGYRLIAHIKNGSVRLSSRRDNDFTAMFQPVAVALSRLGHEAILDGEAVVLDGNGRPNFGLLQSYRERPTGELVYYVFDLLYVDGFDLRDFPLKNRRELLEELFRDKDLPGIELSPAVKENGLDFFASYVAPRDLEGMMAKNLSGPYRMGKRSDDWIKIKRQKTQTAVIAGFTEGRGGRRLGSLVLAVREGNDWKYIGNAGSGFDAAIEDKLIGQLEAIKISGSAVNDVPRFPAKVIWTKPELVCEVRFTEWTADKILRHPVFLGLRPDKKPDEAIMETPESPAGAVLLVAEDKDTRHISVGGEIVPISNFRKIYWPEERYTKFDLAQYYVKMAKYILPHLIDRPESLHRFPHGIDGESFYQKNTADLNLPDWVKTVTIDSESRGAPVQYLLCQNEQTLAYLANLGCIELNPWNSRIGSLDHPDYLVIDLDPGDNPFREVVTVALEVHRIFEELGVLAGCKTSGATGIHIYVPLGARYPYEQARLFAELISNLIHRKLPKLTSVERNPGKRTDKIYLDYLQNKRGQTLAAAYSLRPLPGAPVSTPLSWDELGPDLKPANFTMTNVLERVEKLGDLWQPILNESVDLLSAVDRLYAW
jgi:bifunctional non-homologous end joining protein LigD